MSKKEPKVYVTQETTRADYTPAVQFGDLVFITAMNDKLTPHPGSLNNACILKKVHEKLEDFSENDYLVCSGSPAMMAIVGSVLGDRLKKVLSWDSRTLSYFTVNL